VAENDKALVDAQVQLVNGYYEADTLAERVLADILIADTIPASLHGVDINTRWDDELEMETTFYFCRISDRKALFVNLALHDDSFDILSWRMLATDDWQFDDSIKVWLGEE